MSSRSSFFTAAALLGLISSGLAAPQVAQAAVSSASAAVAPRYGAWHSALIGGGGYIMDVIFAPSKAGRLYTYSDVGGAYRSDDDGKSWRMIHGGLPVSSGVYNVRSLSVSSNNADDLLIATGASWDETGVFRSLDGGATWKKVLAGAFYGNGNFRWDGQILARNPKNPAEVVAASAGEGVFRSLDGGATWKKSLSDLGGVFGVDVRFDRANPRRLWLCAKPDSIWKGDEIKLTGGFFRSDDSGATWQKLSESGPTETLQDPKNAATLYAVWENRGVRRSLDGGASWDDFSQGLNVGSASVELGDTSGAGYNALGAGENFLLAGAKNGDIYRRDLSAGDAIWRKIPRHIEAQNYAGKPWFAASRAIQPFGAALSALSRDPRNEKRWFATDWFGLWQSRDAGQSWSLSMDGVENTCLHTLIQDPSDAGVVHLGMADNGYFRSDDGGARFQHFPANTNMKSLALSPANPAQLYGVGDGKEPAWRSSQVWKSSDRGQSWTPSPMLGLPDPKTHSCNSLAVAPDNADVVFLAVSGSVSAGDGGVYRSRDGGQSWGWMGAGLPSEKAFFTKDIYNVGRELAIDGDGVLLAISRDLGQVFRFDATLQTWKRIPSDFGGQLRSIVAGGQGEFFTAVDGGGVFCSQDGGKNWRNVWKGSAHHLAVDVANTRRIAAGTSDGVIWSQDGGATWQLLDRALPLRSQPFVAFAGQRLMAGTIGSGAFWMALSPAAEKPVKARFVSANTLDQGENPRRR